MRLKVWFFARQLFSNTHPPMTQHVRPFYGSGLRLWKKNILAPLCHPRECGDPTLQGSNLKFWKKNSRIYTLANECDGDRFDGWFPAFARMTAGVSKSPGLPGDCLGSYKKTTLSIAPARKTSSFRARKMLMPTFLSVPF